MQMKAILVEDELRGRNALLFLLNQLPELVQVIGVCGCVEEAKPLIQSLKPDLVFLDIEMPSKNGFDLLREIQDRTFEVIFTTAFNQYAIQAIKLNALDYLLKPIDFDELKQTLQNAVLKIKQKQSSATQIEHLLHNLKTINHTEHKLTLPCAEGVLFVSINQIVRCESDANYTRFYIKDEKPILVCKTMREYEELLADYNFCRIHNSHLINLKLIKKYTKGEGGIVTMVDGAEVEVSRRKKDAFLQKLENLSTIL